MFDPQDPDDAPSKDGVDLETDDFAADAEPGYLPDAGAPKPLPADTDP